jgi:glycerate-2-kinase
MSAPLPRRRLRDDARDIWEAGVEAVRADRLVAAAMRIDGNELVICDERRDIDSVGRIAVVGAGKAGAAMAAAVEQVLAPTALAARLTGWVNVPADCVRSLNKIHLHAARPAGVNEPTEAGVIGSRQILEIVTQLHRDDLCLVLLSGGGSALLPAPNPPVSLTDKQVVTRHLMRAGATIGELNTVRTRLSLIKGGGLARATQAGRLVALIISDVIGDPLATIASGPTCASTATDAGAAAVLQRYAAGSPAAYQRVCDHLRSAAAVPANDAAAAGAAATCRVTNHIIGKNATALAAAAARARQLGYRVVSLGSQNAGEASQEGRHLAHRCRAARGGQSDRSPTDLCLLSGGEPVVDMGAIDRPGKGGRNQQLVLAALVELRRDGCNQIVILAGGTDGEDGPTDAAGALADAELAARVTELQLDPADYLRRFDAYNLFAQVGGLLQTGPTQTNVMDLRVALVRQGVWTPEQPRC